MKPQKTIRTMQIVFGAVAMIFLIASISAAINTLNFLENAIGTEGEVIALAESRSSDSHNSLYAPVVMFTTTEGKEEVFVSSSSSYPAAYDVGESIEVLYLEEDPSEVKIKGFFSFWGISFITGVMGVMFAIFPVTMLVIGIKKTKKKAMLKRNKITIKAKYLGVRMNTMVSINGAQPYVIEAQWKEPNSNKVHVFKSENIWFDPSDFINTEELTIFVDHPRKPKNYWMDISFLPKLA